MNGQLAIHGLLGAALLVLFLIYLVLLPSCPRRFFHYWLVGWALLFAAAICALLPGAQAGRPLSALAVELEFCASIFFLAATFQYIDWEKRVHYLWPAGAVVVTSFTLGLTAVPWLLWVGKAAQYLEAGLYVTAGWLLGRVAHRSGRGPASAALLAGALLLRGLHKLDQGDWLASQEALLRLSFDAFLIIAGGVAMAALVLETARVQTEELNRELARLAEITAEASGAQDLDRMFQHILRQLHESLSTTHGFLQTPAGQGEPAGMVLRASIGFSEEFSLDRHRPHAGDPLAGWLGEQEGPCIAKLDTAPADLRLWMRSEHLATLLVVRLPGRQEPVGLLGVGSGKAREFRADEVDFVMSVASMLGLALQNFRHFEQASRAAGQWAATLDENFDPVLVHDTQFRLLRTNRAAAERLGGAAAAAAGKPLRDVLRRGEARWNHCPYCEGAAGRGDTLDPTFGGYLLATIASYLDPADGRRGVIHVLRDVTGLKRAEEKHRGLLEKMQEGFFVSTPEGGLVEFNETYRQMLGYESREALLEEDIPRTLFVNPADRERRNRLLREHGALTGFEYQLRRQKGEIINVLESCAAIRDASGTVVAYEGFILDITERKQAEVELRRRNRELVLLNAVGLTLSQPLALEDLLGRALRQVTELFGLDLGAVYLLDQRSGMVVRRAAVGVRSGMVAQFPGTLISREMLRNLRQMQTALLAPQALPMIPGFATLHETEGLHVSRLVLFWSKDRILGGLLVGGRTRSEFSTAELNLLAAVGNQISATIEKTSLYEETRQTLEDLRRTQEQLVQSEKMVAIGQLISGVAHELNNPLTAILGYSQLLGSTANVPAPVADFAAKVAKQANRAQRIVQNLLSFARQHKPERRPVQINEVLDDTISLRDYDWRRHNITLHRNLDPRLPMTSADRHQLQQVFLNILNNALDAVKEHPGERWISILTCVRDLRVCIEISDSGPGLREPRRVFDPFYTTKPIGQGTGLGLSICYGIVKEHGGEITARNGSPQGAVFELLLPISTSVIGDEPATRQVAAAPGRAVVLLVDDEEAVLEVEREILRALGHVVYAARSGVEAVEMLKRARIDAVVMDFKLPGEISGEALHGWIAVHRPALAARLVLTVSDAHGEAARAAVRRSGGCTVHKPFRAEEFLQAVQWVMAEGSPLIRE